MLQDARKLLDDGSPAGPEDAARFQAQVQDLYELSLEARDGFLLTAGRSLEAWPVRWYRDRYEPGRQERVLRIREQTQADAEWVRRAQAERSARNEARAGAVTPSQLPRSSSR